MSCMGRVWRAPRKGEHGPDGAGGARGRMPGAPACLPLGPGTGLDQGPWLQSLFSKKGEVVCGKQPWGLFIEVTGNPQRVRTSPGGWTTGSGRGSANCSRLALRPRPSPESHQAWVSQRYRIGARKSEGWAGAAPGEVRAAPGHPGELPGGGTSGLGLGGKRTCPARKGIPV